MYLTFVTSSSVTRRERARLARIFVFSFIIVSLNAIILCTLVLCMQLYKGMGTESWRPAYFSLSLLFGIALLHLYLDLQENMEKTCQYPFIVYATLSEIVWEMQSLSVYHLTKNKFLWGAAITMRSVTVHLHCHRDIFETGKTFQSLRWLLGLLGEVRLNLYDACYLPRRLVELSEIGHHKLMRLNWHLFADWISRKRQFWSGDQGCRHQHTIKAWGILLLSRLFFPPRKTQLMQ